MVLSVASLDESGIAERQAAKPSAQMAQIYLSPAEMAENLGSHRGDVTKFNTLLFIVY